MTRQSWVLRVGKAEGRSGQGGAEQKTMRGNKRHNKRHLHILATFIFCFWGVQGWVNSGTGRISRGRIRKVRRGDPWRPTVKIIYIVGYRHLCASRDSTSCHSTLIRFVSVCTSGYITASLYVYTQEGTLVALGGVTLMAVINGCH